MTFSNRVTSITQDLIVPSAVDAVLSDNFISYRILGNAQRWSGVTLDRPIKVAKSTLGGSFSGLDTHSTSTVETRVKMSFDLRGYEMPVAIPGMDKAVNRTDAQVIDLLKIEVESAQEDAMDDTADMFYGDGTGNSSKDFNGLKNLIDDGSTYTTIGGLTRATYDPYLDSTVTASGGTMDSTKIATLVSNVGAGSSPRNRPSFLLSNETVQDLYDELLTPTIRANYESFGLPMMTRTSKAPVRASELKGAYGFTSYTFRGIPWVADEKATSQTLFAVNETYLLWYGLKDPDLKDISMQNVLEGTYSDAPSSNVGFQWTDFMVPINQYGIVAHIYLLGNMVNWNPKRDGKLTGITGV